MFAMETVRGGREEDFGKHPKPPTVCVKDCVCRKAGGGETEDKKHVTWQHFTNTQEPFLEHN